MPRDGSGTYSLPAGTEAVASTTADSSDVNSRFNDIASDLNTVRPVGSGGTGASNAAGARTNLGLGTIATQAADSVDLDGRAIDGTAIGGTTPAAGDFTNVTASGTLDITGTASFADGTFSTTLDVTGAATFSSTVGITDDLAVDTDTLFVDASTDRVGIGLTAPERTLHVFSGDSTASVITGSTVFIEHSGDCGIQIATASGNQTYLFMGTDNDTQYGRILADESASKVYLKSTGSLVFQTGGFSERVTIDTSGNITGVGSISAATIAGDWIASQAEAEAGTSTNQVMTPQRTQQAIDALSHIIAAGRFDGTGTPAWDFREGFGATITDNGTGDYTLAFDSAEADANYLVFVTVLSPGAGISNRVEIFAHSLTTAGFDVRSVNASGTATDYADIQVQVIRKTWV